MRRRKWDAGGYRGRRTATDILKLIAIALGVLVVLMLAITFWMRDELADTDGGLWSVLFQKEKDPLPDPGDVSYVELPAGSMSEQEDGDPPMSALLLPVDSLLDGTAAAALEAAGANAVVLEMKGPDGRLAWSSQQELAVEAGADGRQEVNDALEQWCAGETYTVAWVCCFRDDSIPYHRRSLGLPQGDGNWRDELGLRWMSPALDETRAYLTALCGQLAAMGVDEIVLEQYGSPARGALSAITRGERYDPDKASDYVEALLYQIGEAVRPYGTALSLRVERETLAGEETNSGITGRMLEDHAARIWVEEDGQPSDLTGLMERAGVTGGRERSVVIVSELDRERDRAQAKLWEEGPG